MVRYELLKVIENAQETEIQELLNAVMKRYRQLYPDWSIIHYSVYKKDPKEHRRQVFSIIKFMIKHELLGNGLK